METPAFRKVPWMSLLIGLGVRIALAPISAHPWDTNVFFDTAAAILHGQSFYVTTSYSYPPVWAGFLAIVGVLYQPLSVPLGAHPLAWAEVDLIMGVPTGLGSPLLVDWLFLLLMKAPLIAGDLLTGILLARIVAQRLGQPEKSGLAFSAFFLNPFVIWISSVWGMFDILPTYFVILGTLLFMDKKGVAAGIAFGIGIGLKYFPALLVIALLLGLRKSQDRRTARNLVLGLIGVIALFSLPFLLAEPGEYLRGTLSPTAGQTTGQLSIWVVAHYLGILNLPLWASALNVGAILGGIVFVSWCIGSRSKGGGSTRWIDLSLLSILLIYVLFRLMNDQYAVWIIPFLTLDWVLRRGPRWSLALFSALLLVSGLVNVGHYSFFLPLITISPGLAPFVPQMLFNELARAILGMVVWVVAAYLLFRRLRDLFSKGEMLRLITGSIRSILASGRRWVSSRTGAR